MLLLIVMGGCAANHTHDGLYIADKTVTGVIKVWILDGNEVTIYSMGAQHAVGCKQYDDRIEIKGEGVYRFENDSTILVAGNSRPDAGYKMIRTSKNTQFKIADLDKLIEKRSQEQIHFKRNSPPTE